MAALQRILVPVDGSPSADLAIALALRLAREHEAEVLFCNAVNHAAMIAETTTPYGYTDVSGVFEALDSLSKERLDAATARATAASVRSSACKLEGRAAEAIVSCSLDRKADAIVIGTRGEGGVKSFFLGSTAEGVLRAASVPVFVVHDGCTIPGIEEKAGFGTILVALDESDPSDAAAAFATGLAASSGSRLVFSHVVDTDALDEQTAKYGSDAKAFRDEWEAEGNQLVSTVAKKARLLGVKSVEESVAAGEPVSGILELSDAAHAGLIAMGTHGRRGLRRLIMGSVAENVVRRSPIPVLVLRSFAERSRGRRAEDNGTTHAQRVTA